MIPNWKEIWLSIMLGLVMPAVVLSMAVHFRPPVRTQEELHITEITSQTQPKEKPVMIPVLTDGFETVEMELEEYLVGVILAEMPVSFEMEAQKAQAVVARTFTLRCVQGGKHDEASVCMNSACCQAYIAPEEYLEKGGTQEGVDRMRRAVEQTAGEVLTYNGSLIEATYFSCSGGATEDAVAVWGTDVAYLRSVESPGEEHAAHYTDTVTYQADAFADALGLHLNGSPESWLGNVTYTAGGGVDTMVIGGISFQGTDLRKTLGLRSTAFTMTAGEDSIAITTRGYGHRVGMSQYGADAMAMDGSGYEEILTHYYQGTKLDYWEN